MVQLAGVKGFVVDPQLATRTMPIRILKPMETGHYHWAWPDGTLLKNWIKAEAPRLLAAIYAVISEWDRIGSPGEEAESRFPLVEYSDQRLTDAGFKSASRNSGTGGYPG